MCGRYAFYQRPAQVRQQLQDSNMPSQEAPEDDEVRQTYNFAPGNHGLVYRADTPDTGGGRRQEDGQDNEDGQDVKATKNKETATQEASGEVRYKLQAMKWGLIPFWTKRSPDYGSMLRTINCRDDSLIEDRGMWTSMKRKKRCIVVAQGFYEWLKKNNGKERIPHFVKRKDGQLMCFAGLWDCVRYEGASEDEKLYTYTIITTDSNKQLNFLHDRMPVILDNGSEAIRTWLDPTRTEWSKDLQSLLKPYQGELECYPVNKDVGKVGNNSPSFIVPLDSKENKSNIANFFGNQKKAATGVEPKKILEKSENEVDAVEQKPIKAEDEGEERITVDAQSTEDNAPKPVPAHESPPRGTKRDHGDVDGTDRAETPKKQAKADVKVEAMSPSKAKTPVKSSKKTRSATSNGTVAKSPSKPAGGGSQKITAFFGK
ncbi:DUF159-domain-containing protein [Rhizodiscina lignyota]|uniref:DUF159-domain-containing protein n=1 Tax=Rhizodiscina lignyota TaxID=1504668 RepID=A0A9P4IED5_9PEZI|nr:DUF159-domain-containing protein [Rhizodiscina lignyota]